jgi:putative cell wall-binding protein
MVVAALASLGVLLGFLPGAAPAAAGTLLSYEQELGRDRQVTFGPVTTNRDGTRTAFRAINDFYDDPTPRIFIRGANSLTEHIVGGPGAGTDDRTLFGLALTASGEHLVSTWSHDDGRSMIHITDTDTAELAHSLTPNIPRHGIPSVAVDDRLAVIAYENVVHDLHTGSEVVVEGTAPSSLPSMTASGGTVVWPAATAQGEAALVVHNTSSKATRTAPVPELSEIAVSRIAADGSNVAACSQAWDAPGGPQTDVVLLRMPDMIEQGRWTVEGVCESLDVSDRGERLGVGVYRTAGASQSDDLVVIDVATSQQETILGLRETCCQGGWEMADDGRSLVVNSGRVLPGSPDGTDGGQFVRRVGAGAPPLQDPADPANPTPDPTPPDPAPQPPEAPPPACPFGDVHVLGVRGSGQNARDAAPELPDVRDPLGRPLADFVLDLRYRLAQQGLETTYEGIRYPAIDTMTAFIDAVLTVDRQYPYERSARRGLDSLRSRISTVRYLCPETSVFLAGYSQGADVVGGYLHSTSINLVDEQWFGGAYLFADPRMNPSDPVVVGTFRDDQYVFSQEGLFGARPRFPDNYARRVESICMRDDGICASKPTNTLGAATIHTRYASLTYGGTRLTDYAATRAAQFIQAGRRLRQGSAVSAALSGPAAVAPGAPFSLSAHGTTGGAPPLEFEVSGDGVPDLRTSSPEIELIAPAGEGAITYTVAVTDSTGARDMATVDVRVDRNAQTVPDPPAAPTLRPGFASVTVSPPAKDPRVEVHLVVDDDGRVLQRMGDAPVRVRLTSPTSLHLIAFNNAGASRPGWSEQALPDIWPLPDDAPVRTSGPTAPEAAAALALQMWPDGAITAVIAHQDDYPDALAASAVAGARDAPLLYSDPGALHPATSAALTDLGVRDVVLMGGTTALSDDVEQTLIGQGLHVTRVAGPNRYATAAAAAATSAHAIVVEGAHADAARGWPDAVAAASFAAQTGWPILLVERDRLPTETLAALLDSDIGSVTVVGGEAAVSEGVLTELAAAGVAAERIHGPTRYGTSAEVASEQLQRGADPDGVMVASGRGWQDALAAGSAAAALQLPLLLVDGVSRAGGAEAYEFLDGSRRRLWVHQTEEAITDDVFARLVAATGAS